MPKLRTAALALALLAGLGPAAAQDRPEPRSMDRPGPALLFSVGPDFGAGRSRAWREGFASLERRSDTPLRFGLRPLQSVSVGRHGAVLATVGVHAVWRVGPVTVTPHFGPGLYHGGGRFDAKELLQFRSGVDVFLPLTERTAIGLGIVHVSNARITRRSANLDIVRLSILWRN